MKTLIIILGPTASGKTDNAIEIASHFNSEIISADSRQVFKELKIGSAMPDNVQSSRVKHYFIADRSVIDNFNAYIYETQVIKLLDDIVFKNNDIAVMSGGSMLYIDAVCNGIDFLPDADPKLRSELQSLLDNFGTEYLAEKLKTLDPDYYNIVDKKNGRRLIKALEISIQTGLPYSAFRTGEKKQRNFRIIKIGLNLEREKLHQRINLRTDKMMALGLENEARNLYHFGRINALNTVGYREMFDYFDGITDLNTAIELIKRNTRRYARKQISWFGRDKNTVWFQPDQTPQIINYLENILK